MQEVQNVYLKRHGKKEGTRRWSIITYGKFDEWDVRNYSLELANCEEDDVPYMIDEWYKPDEVTFDDLWEIVSENFYAITSIKFQIKKSLPPHFFRAPCLLVGSLIIPSR